MLVGKRNVDGWVVGVDVASTKKIDCSASLSKLFSGNLLENFNVDNSTYAQARKSSTYAHAILPTNNYPSTKKISALRRSKLHYKAHS
jgi:hypothetical protein